jgi:tetratricopeptide (TPR) repeat protein
MRNRAGTKALSAVILTAALAAPSWSGEQQALRYVEQTAQPFFADDGAGGLRSAREGAATATFLRRKRPGVFRAFVVGGSIAARYMSERSRLGRDLAGFVENPVEAVGCGMAVYSSSEELPIVREVAGYSPDVVVLMSGNNEAIRFGQRAPNTTERFKANIRAMAKEAKLHGADMLIVVPPLNFAAVPVDAERLATGGPGGLPLSRPAFLRAWGRFLRGECAQARRDWDALSALDDEDRAAALYYAARASDCAVDPTGADARYERLSESVSHPLYCSAACRRALREVAAEEGAGLVDLDKAFRAVASPRMPGFEMFTDAVHWNHRFDALVSKEIIATLRARPVGRSLRWRARPKPPAERDDDDHDLLSMLRYALVEAADKEDPPPAALAKVERALSRQPRWFDDPEALYRRVVEDSGMMGKAWGMTPRYCSVSTWLFVIGVARLELRQPARALESFDEALKRDPKATRVSLYQAVAHWAAGDLARARGLLDAARARYPNEAALLRDALAGL